MVISWFSAGVSSALCTKLMIHEIDKIIYIHINDQQPDTLRFVKDCEDWFGKKIDIVQSIYKDVNTVILEKGYINYGGRGAVCSRFLKRQVRLDYEKDKKDLTYVWGIDAREEKRQYGIVDAMPNQKHIFPLIDQGITKNKAHQMLRTKIKRPQMYDLGYSNNN